MTITEIYLIENINRSEMFFCTISCFATNGKWLCEVFKKIPIIKISLDRAANFGSLKI